MSEKKNIISTSSQHDRVRNACSALCVYSFIAGGTVFEANLKILWFNWQMSTFRSYDDFCSKCINMSAVFDLLSDDFFFPRLSFFSVLGEGKVFFARISTRRQKVAKKGQFLYGQKCSLFSKNENVEGLSSSRTGGERRGEKNGRKCENNWWSVGVCERWSCERRNIIEKAWEKAIRRSVRRYFSLWDYSIF